MIPWKYSNLKYFLYDIYRAYKNDSRLNDVGFHGSIDHTTAKTLQGLVNGIMNF